MNGRLTSVKKKKVMQIIRVLHTDVELAGLATFLPSKAASISANRHCRDA